MERELSRAVVTARKAYRCDACHWWDRSGYGIADCETEEQKHALEEAQANGWKIHPGQKYLRVTGIQDGELVTYRARPDMDELCTALDIFDE